MDRLKMKPGQVLGSTSNTPLMGKSWAPNPYSIPWTEKKNCRSVRWITRNTTQKNAEITNSEKHPMWNSGFRFAVTHYSRDQQQQKTVN